MNRVPRCCAHLVAFHAEARAREVVRATVTVEAWPGTTRRNRMRPKLASWRSEEQVGAAHAMQAGVLDGATERTHTHRAAGRARAASRPAP